MDKENSKRNKIIFLISTVIILLVVLIGYLFFVSKHNPANFRTGDITKHSSEIYSTTNTNFISLPIPIGAYSVADVSSTVCGLATEKGIVGSADDLKSFNDPHRYLAQLIWFGGDG